MAAPEPLNLQLERFAPLLNLKKEGAKKWVQCGIRKNWLVLQPEEFVRQLLLHFLLSDMKYNRNRITIERGLWVNEQQKRTDLLVFDREMRPFLLIECKAPKSPLNEAVFRQASTYNTSLRVPYLMVTNGRESYIAEIDYQDETFQFLPSVPEFPR